MSEREHGGEVAATEDGVETASGNDPARSGGETPTADHVAAEDQVHPTGVAAADAAAQRLAEIEDAPVEAHVGIYEDVHRRLQEGLADLDEQ